LPARHGANHAGEKGIDNLYSPNRTSDSVRNLTNINNKYIEMPYKVMSHYLKHIIGLSMTSLLQTAE